MSDPYRALNLVEESWRIPNLPWNSRLVNNFKIHIKGTQQNVSQWHCIFIFKRQVHIAIFFILKNFLFTKVLLKIWLTSSKTEAFDNCVYETKSALFGSLSLEEFHLKTKKEIWENSKLCVSFIFFFITHHHIPQSKSLSRQVTKCADEAVITLMACSRNLIIEGFDSSRLRLL